MTNSTTAANEATASALTPEEMVAGYFRCWNAADEQSRAEAIERTWAVEARSVDPLADVSGHQAIATMMAEVMTGYPGHRFEHRGAVDAHHDVVRWGWAMLDGDGNQVLDGIDVVRVDGAGRIADLAGFFGATVPEADSDSDSVE